MYKYRLIEFNSDRRETTLRSNESDLQQILMEFYNEDFVKIFDESGFTKGYISVFINSQQISSIKNVVLSPNDEVCIVTSIAGG